MTDTTFIEMLRKGGGDLACQSWTWTSCSSPGSC